jgi:hypothetical protein
MNQTIRTASGPTASDELIVEVDLLIIHVRSDILDDAVFGTVLFETHGLTKLLYALVRLAACIQPGGRGNENCLVFSERPSSSLLADVE